MTLCNIGDFVEIETFNESILTGEIVEIGTNGYFIRYDGYDFSAYYVKFDMISEYKK